MAPSRNAPGRATRWRRLGGLARATIVASGLALGAGGAVAQAVSPPADVGSAPAARRDAGPVVAPPRAPGPYAVPSGAVRVESTRELLAALAGSATEIVLADGTYDHDGPITVPDGEHLYAEHLGGAVLRAGLVLGGNYSRAGALVRGLVLDVADPGRVFGGGLIHVWGPGGADAAILDTVVHGNRVIPYGLLVYSPQGLVARRLQLTGFTDVGLRASDNIPVPYGSRTPRIRAVSDIVVDGVSRPTPGASRGTAEAGVWIGHPVREGVRRVVVRNASWSGIETCNNAWDTAYSDLDIDLRGPTASRSVGFYLEHHSVRLTIERFSIVARTGITAEWADPSRGGLPGSRDLRVTDGVVEAAGGPAHGPGSTGVYLDDGTESTLVRRVVFLGQTWAGIGAYRNVGVNRFVGNRFRLAPQAVAISDRHP